MSLLELHSGQGYLTEQQRIVQLSCISHRYSVSNDSDITPAELSAYLLGATLVWNAFMTRPTHFSLDARNSLEKLDKLSDGPEVAGYYYRDQDTLMVATLVARGRITNITYGLPSMLSWGAHEGTHKVQAAQGFLKTDWTSLEEYYKSLREAEAKICALAAMKSVFPRLRKHRLHSGDQNIQKLFDTHRHKKFSSTLVGISREQVRRDLNSSLV